MNRKCTSCHSIKDTCEYYKKSNGLFGKFSECKECIRARDEKWRNSNSERKSEKGKILYQQTKEKRSMQNKAWRERNPDYMRKYREKVIHGNVNKLV